MDLFRKIKRGKLEFPSHASEDVKKLITRILRVAPSERPEPNEVSTVLVQSINFFKIIL
jgi:hypothetical protein